MKLKIVLAGIVLLSTIAAQQAHASGGWATPYKVTTINKGSKTISRSIMTVPNANVRPLMYRVLVNGQEAPFEAWWGPVALFECRPSYAWPQAKISVLFDACSAPMRVRVLGRGRGVVRFEWYRIEWAPEPCPIRKEC